MAALALTLGLALGAAAPATALELSCERIPGLLNAFLHKHISFRHMNDELRTRSIEAYVKRLDPSKTLYTADEAADLKNSLRGIFFDVGSGECGRLEEIQQDIISRYDRMKSFIENSVGADDYAVDPTVELIIDPEKRAYPKDTEQQHDLYTKLIHFQMSNYLSTGISLDEAKKKLIHRYELMVKRAQEFDQEDIYSLFLDSFASAMDPHSNYMSAEVEEDFKIQMGLSLIGIGVALSSRDGYSVVEKIIPGGAADRVDKLRPKDKVIAVAQDGEEPIDVIDMDLRKVVRLIRGERETTVHLTVLRQNPKTERFVVSIVRDKINLEEQAAKLSYKEIEIAGKKEKLAVIDLPSFYGGRDPNERKCSNDVKDLIAQANEAGAVGLLLDLSRNGGGLLDTARDIAGFFIGEGGIVAVKDEFGNVQVLRDHDPKILFDGPMVVLTSRISASASEIVAGAMKDYKRAVVVGDDHTFGKGTVQTLVPLPPGLGALKVTTALFFRPGGHSTQHSGVDSDIILPSIFNSDEFGEAYQPYSLESATISPFIDELANPIQSSTESDSYYDPIQDALVTQLAALSAKRVSVNEDFAEIEEKLEEAKSRGGVIRLSEILKENEQGESDTPEDVKAPDAAKTGPQDEAVKPAAETGEPSDADDAASEGEGDKHEPTPQRLEALQILEDFVRISRGSDPGALAATAAAKPTVEKTP